MTHNLIGATEILWKQFWCFSYIHWNIIQFCISECAQPRCLSSAKNKNKKRTTHTTRTQTHLCYTNCTKIEIDRKIGLLWQRGSENIQSLALENSSGTTRVVVLPLKYLHDRLCLKAIFSFSPHNEKKNAATDFCSKVLSKKKMSGLNTEQVPTFTGANFILLALSQA